MKKLLLIAVLLFSGMANALVVAPTQKTEDTVYHVKTTGNNSNPCTATKPCANLATACTKVTKAGSTIKLWNGTYTETTQCTLAVGVSIEGQDKVNTIVRAGTSGMTLLRGVSSEGTYGNNEISFLTIDGNAQLGWSIGGFYGRSNIKIHDIIIKDWRDDGFFVTGKAVTSLDDREASIYAKNIEIYNVTGTNSSSFQGGYGHGIFWIGSLDGFSIHDNNLNQSGRTAGTNGYTIKFYNHGHLKNGKIYNNTLYHDDNTTFDFAMETWAASCIELFNNTITGTADLEGSFVGECGYSYHIHHNTFTSTAYGVNNYAIDVEQGSRGMIIEQNKFVNKGSGIIFHDNTWPVEFSDFVIRNNLFLNVRFGLSYAVGNANVQYNNFEIYNNTLIGEATNGFAGIVIPGGVRTNNFVVRNNIIRGFLSAPIFIYNQSGSAEYLLDSISIENNIMFANGNSNVAWWNGVIATNLTDQNNIIADPLIVSLTDPHLQSGSPARGAALPTKHKMDYNGWRRIARDIGAYDYSTIP